MNERLRRVLFRGAVLLGAGGAYCVWLKLTGLGVPCVFNLLTGLKCPGCGVSRMLLALLRLDFAEAFRQTAVLLCLTPLFAALFISWLVRYIRTGDRALTRAENAAVIASSVLLAIWSVVRNLPLLPAGLS